MSAFQNAIKKFGIRGKFIAGDSYSFDLPIYIANESLHMLYICQDSLEKILLFCIDKNIKCMFQTIDGELFFGLSIKII